MLSRFFIEDPKQHAKCVQIQSSARAWYISLHHIASDFKLLCGVVVPLSMLGLCLGQPGRNGGLSAAGAFFQRENMIGLYESLRGPRLGCISHWNALLRVLQSKGLI